MAEWTIEPSTTGLLTTVPQLLLSFGVNNLKILNKQISILSITHKHKHWGTKYAPQHDKTNKMSVRPAKTLTRLGMASAQSDQSFHCMKKAWVLSYPLSAQRRVWSVWADAQADLSLHWAHTHFAGFVMSWLMWTCINATWKMQHEERQLNHYYHRIKVHDVDNKFNNKWAASWQNQQSECAPSEDSDQPGHPPSLIWVLAVRMKKAWTLSYPSSAQRRLWSDWVDAQADLNLRWAHSHIAGFVTRRLIYQPINNVFEYELSISIKVITNKITSRAYFLASGGSRRGSGCPNEHPLEPK